MKCPRCGTEITDAQPQCPECGFSMADLTTLAGGPPPERKGFVNDFAGVIPGKVAKRLERRLRDFKEKVGPELVLATVQTTAPLKPSEYVFWLHNQWELGGEANLGVLILVALQERRVESEVGYGLEHIVTDAASERLLNEVMVPYLKQGDFGGAAEQGAEALIHLLLEAAETLAKSAEQQENPPEESNSEAGQD